MKKPLHQVWLEKQPVGVGMTPAERKAKKAEDAAKERVLAILYQIPEHRREAVLRCAAILLGIKWP